MKKFSVFLIALTMVFSLVLSGCNNKKETQTTSVAHTVVSQETFTEYRDSVSFYVMRIGDAYVRRPGTADTVLADDSGELPDLEDGQIAYVTADVKDVGTSFGYVPTHTYYITNLISVEYMSYEDVVSKCNVPELGADEKGFYWYRHNDTLYLVVLRTNVYAYTDEGKFTEYERPRYANELFDQFLKEVEERG